jgi:hypothetical protein
VFKNLQGLSKANCRVVSLIRSKANGPWSYGSIALRALTRTAQRTVVALFAKDGLASHTNFGIKFAVLYKFGVSFFRKQCKFEDSDRSKHVIGTVAKTLATSLASYRRFAVW